LFGVKRPCSDCPFRKVGAIELRPGRLDGIVAHLLADDWHGFPCHQKPTAQCAGGMVYLLKAGQQSVPMRLACAVGELDFDRLCEFAADVIDPPKEKAPVRGPNRAAKRRAH
jgi:hypothetical protein